MKSFDDEVIFTVGERDYLGKDVILAAKLWGDWNTMEQEVRKGIACWKKWEEGEEDMVEDEIESTAAEFRYAHNLITAEETESWLQARNVTTEKWMDYIHRLLLRRNWAAGLDRILTEYPSGDAEVASLMEQEALLSGEMARLSYKLAGRASIYESQTQTILTNSLSPEVHSYLQAFPEIFEQEPRKRIEHLAELELFFKDFCRKTATPGMIRQQVHNHSMDWIRFDLVSATFLNRQAAQEAVLCVKEDGRDIVEVAAEAKVKSDRQYLYFHQLDPSISDRFWGAQKGELLGPIELTTGFILYYVIDKNLPSADDPEIERKAEETLINSIIDREINNRVKWHTSL